ncbi:hypothetical protein CS8_029960 [Cupriavidus sp. 8B]
MPQYLLKLVCDPGDAPSMDGMENSESARAGRPITYRELVKRNGLARRVRFNAPPAITILLGCTAWPIRLGCEWRRKWRQLELEQGGGLMLLKAEGVTVVDLDYDSGWQDTIDLRRLGRKAGIRVEYRGQENISVKSPTALVASLMQPKTTFWQRNLLLSI